MRSANTNTLGSAQRTGPEQYRQRSPCSSSASSNLWARSRARNSGDSAPPTLTVSPAKRSVMPVVRASLRSAGPDGPRGETMLDRGKPRRCWLSPGGPGGPGVCEVRVENHSREQHHRTHALSLCVSSAAVEVPVPPGPAAELLGFPPMSLDRAWTIRSPSCGSGDGGRATRSS
jgi:hypothetical protein